jgi:hypothetical protein
MIHLTPADLIKREIKMKDLIKCLVIFDDIHSIANKAELKAVESLSAELLERSRKFEIDLLYISHAGSDYKKTKQITLEATHVWFCLGDVNANLLYTLKKFGIESGLVRKMIEKRSEYGRWVMFSTNGMARYVISVLRTEVYSDL